MKIKVIYKDTLCCFMHVNKSPPLMKMAYFKPKIQKKTHEIRTYFREISLSEIHLLLCYLNAPITTSQNSILTFLQTNIARSSDTDKIHFSHSWLGLCQVQPNISSLHLGKNILQTDIQPYPLIFIFSAGPFL